WNGCEPRWRRPVGVSLGIRRTGQDTGRHQIKQPALRASVGLFTLAKPSPLQFFGPNYIIFYRHHNYTVF
ncbi:hypothetical protein, partial [Serratia odorifera]|uniref:hypothetical protein n=1 Tax=Serratia odorifera TaxID=618 RepID=UPI001E64E671